MKYWMTICLAFWVTTTASAAEQDTAAPRAALLLYDKLVGPNDVAKAIELYQATTTREKVLAEGLAAMDGAAANLRAKAALKFGKEIADAMIKSVGVKTADDIQAAKITMKGETAEVMFAGDSEPMQMVRVNGDWKISVKPMIAEATRTPREYKKALMSMAAALNKTATDIENGQYTGPEEPSLKILEAQKKAFEPKGEE